MALIRQTRSARAALYLRSSKDRSDVSIDTQRRELRKLAADRSLIVVTEYTDVVESGKDEYRPGFQRMLADMKASGRNWDTLLMLDTSRLARRRLTSIMFEDQDAKRYGIGIIYKNLPELEAAESMLLRNQLQGLDEYHSLISKRKGLGGMATNVANGYRAGGRAPRGYRLKKIHTNVYRDGEEVTKSVLELSDEAPLVTRYLKARALSSSRHALRAELGIAWPETGLIGMEWNALTYAGHTVWNVHNEFTPGTGYKDGQKRRPRSEWVIKHSTHPALITEAEATAILQQLEQSNHNKKRRTNATYLLSGLLHTPSGTGWHGNGIGRYRSKETRRNVAQGAIEHAVVRQVIEDLRAPAFAQRLALEAHRYAARFAVDPVAPLRPQLTDISNKISRMMDLAAEMAQPGPALRKIEELERQRQNLADEIARSELDYASASVLRNVTEERLQTMLGELVEKLEGAHREETKDLLTSLVDRVVLDPESLECQIHYKIPVRDKRASPWGRQLIPIQGIVNFLQKVA